MDGGDMYSNCCLKWQRWKHKVKKRYAYIIVQYASSYWLQLTLEKSRLNSLSQLLLTVHHHQRPPWIRRRTSSALSSLPCSLTAAWCHLLAPERERWRLISKHTKYRIICWLHNHRNLYITKWSSICDMEFGGKWCHFGKRFRQKVRLYSPYYMVHIIQ